MPPKRKRAPAASVVVDLTDAAAETSHTAAQDELPPSKRKRIAMRKEDDVQVQHEEVMPLRRSRRSTAGKVPARAVESAPVPIARSTMRSMSKKQAVSKHMREPETVSLLSEDDDADALTHKTGQSATVIPRKPTGFLDLPPEVRNSVYELTFGTMSTQYGRIYIERRGRTKIKYYIGTEAQPAVLTAFALLRCSRQIREEASPMFRSNNYFFTRMRLEHIPDFFLRTVGPAGRTNIKNLLVTYRKDICTTQEFYSIKLDSRLEYGKTVGHLTLEGKNRAHHPCNCCTERRDVYGTHEVTQDAERLAEVLEKQLSMHLEFGVLGELGSRCE